MKLYIPDITFSGEPDFHKELCDYFQLTYEEVKFIENGIDP